MTHKCSESLGKGRKSKERVNATKVLSSRCIESHEAYMHEDQGKVSNFEKDKNYKIDLKLDPNIVSLLQLNQDDYDLSDLLTNDTSKLHISEEIGHVLMDLKPLESRIFLFKR